MNLLDPCEPEAGRPGIALVGVTKSFGAVRAVAGVDLHIGPGETVALLGPNGAGKSTTLDLMLGLLRPDAGEIRVFGMAPDEAVGQGVIAAMLQTGSVVPLLSVRELVGMIGSLYPDARPVEEVLEVTGLDALAARHVEKLSGGQAQRVRLACALVSGARLLVLDEPTVALDVEARHSFWSTMRAVAETGRTIVFATHYLEEADAFADRVVLMAGGRIVADGPATEIKATVANRTIRATLPGVDRSELAALPTVTGVERHGDAVILSCRDSDQVLRALVARYPAARDFEVRGAGIEEAFLALTGAPAEATR